MNRPGSADTFVGLRQAGPYFNWFIHSYPQPAQVVALDKTRSNSCNPPFFQIQGILP